MWETSDTINIQVRRNTITPIGFEIWDEVANAACDVSGYSIVMRIADADGDDNIAEFTAIEIDLAKGQFDFELDGTRFNAVSGSKETVNLSFQMLALSPQETVTIAGGSIILVPGIL